MKITQDVRDYAASLEIDATEAETVRMIDVEKEMAEKSREFRDTGSAIYHKVWVILVPQGYPLRTRRESIVEPPRRHRMPSGVRRQFSLQAAKTSMNNPFAATDIDIQQTETVFKGFFRILKYRLRHRLFNGGWSQPMTRELFARGDSVGVLLYDSQRDCVALAQQFRIGCLENTGGAWVWEVVAGMVKPNEIPTEVAVREVAEEAQVHITAAQLSSICSYYSSPGGTDEHLHLFCAGVI